MKKHKTVPVLPDPVQWREIVTGIRMASVDLSHARVLPEAYVALVKLYEGVSKARELCKIFLSHGSSDLKTARKELKFYGATEGVLKTRLDLRALRGEVRNEVLRWAKTGRRFEVDDLRACSALLRGLSRKSLVSTLHNMAKSGLLRLVSPGELGRGSRSAAVFTLDKP